MERMSKPEYEPPRITVLKDATNDIYTAHGIEAPVPTTGSHSPDRDHKIGRDTPPLNIALELLTDIQPPEDTRPQNPADTGKN